MRHIAIIIFFGALLQGCGENRNKEVSTKSSHKVQTKTLSSAPMATPQKAPVRKQAQSGMINDKVTTGRAAPSIPAQKKALRAMTFNESQFSDDANDYPSTLEAKKLEKEKYNQ